MPCRVCVHSSGSRLLMHLANQRSRPDTSPYAWSPFLSLQLDKGLYTLLFDLVYLPGAKHTVTLYRNCTCVGTVSIEILWQ